MKELAQRTRDAETVMVVKNLDKELAKKSSQDNIQLEVMDGADHSFRDLYSEEIVELSVDFINPK